MKNKRLPYIKNIGQLETLKSLNYQRTSYFFISSLPIFIRNSISNGKYVKRGVYVIIDDIVCLVASRNFGYGFFNSVDDAVKMSNIESL